jgi:hypothetical protein
MALSGALSFLCEVGDAAFLEEEIDCIKEYEPDRNPLYETNDFGDHLLTMASHFKQGAVIEAILARKEQNDIKLPFV